MVDHIILLYIHTVFVDSFLPKPIIKMNFGL